MIRKHLRGLSLIEVLGSLAIGALLFAALGAVALQSGRALEAVNASTQLQQEAQFAVDRMIDAVRASPRLLLPTADRPSTPFNEAQRNVLAVTLDPTLDRNGDGFADADNDHDGRIDEDVPEDITNDGAAGIIGIDDDGDGSVDEGSDRDDDEDGASNEDSLDGADNDGDGLVDEDANADVNDDGRAGVAGVDDDSDGSVDEGNNQDDDEDGATNEDWLDPRVFRLNGMMLVERLPDPGATSGAVFTERPIATNVSNFTVTYWPPAAAGLPAMLEITLTLTGPGGASASVDARVRVGVVP
jgi:hypothetical protein